MTGRDGAVPREAATSTSRRVLLVLAWAVVAAVAGVLVAQRHADAVASGLGMDLEFFLDAAALARAGEDPYDAEGYTYTPLLAWLLMPLAGSDAAMPVWTAATLASGALGIILVVLAVRGRLGGWRTPAVAAIAAVTLLYNPMLSIELFLGQAQLPLLALIAAAVLAGDRAPALSGVLLGLGALLKTWPVVLIAWFLRAGQVRPARAVLGALATVGAFLAITAVVLGPQGLGRLVERTLGLSEQPLDLFSVWFFARQGVAGTDEPVPLGEAPVFGLLLSVVLALGVAALVLLVLRRPGDRSLAMWNLVGATTLLLPVSHPFYLLLVLPLLWVWVAVALDPRSPGGRRDAAVAVAVLAAWWVVVFRLPIDDAGWRQFATVTATLVAIAVSGILAARLGSAVGATAGSPRADGSPRSPDVPA